ncbi:MAG TPA: methyltransferase domain-containing protein [Thermoleophilaceae bacterium]
MSEVHETASKAWGESADLYERARPEYPPEAIDFFHELGLGPDGDVLDLAAGTGKLTRALIAAGARVTAVEPLAAMRQMLQQRLPEATVMAGTAENIPVQDESMDLVTVAQAFHWFDADTAMNEIARVLRPGGGLGAIWNVRDESVEWMAMIRELIESARSDTPSHQSGEWRKPFDSPGSPFEPLRVETFRHTQQVTRADAVDVFASRSYVASLPADERDHLLERVAEQVPRTEIVAMPYITELYWTRKST